MTLILGLFRNGFKNLVQEMKALRVNQGGNQNQHLDMMRSRNWLNILRELLLKEFH